MLQRLLALTVLVCVSAFIFQRLHTTPQLEGGHVTDISTRAPLEEWHRREGPDPISSCGPGHFEDEHLLMRLDPYYVNTVRCWPSVGGIIMAQRVHPVELVFLDLDRFSPTLRSSNATEEDLFCKKLRMIGGKWWESYDDFEHATLYGLRQLWSDEKDVLYIGWPKDGGVWLSRKKNWENFGGKIGIIYNALTMEERCLAIKLSGGTFFENPEDSEHIRPLVQSFGDREPRGEPDLADLLDSLF